MASKSPKLSGKPSKLQKELRMVNDTNLGRPNVLKYTLSIQGPGAGSGTWPWEAEKSKSDFSTKMTQTGQGISQSPRLKAELDPQAWR